MKILFVVLLGFGLSEARADDYVQGHTRSNGTYVQGYYRTRADHTPTNNYSYPGNSNPHHQTHNFGTQMGSQAPSYGQFGR